MSQFSIKPMSAKQPNGTTERIVICDSVTDFMNVAVGAGAKANRHFRDGGDAWRGVKMRDISELPDTFNTPYTVGVDRINAMVRAMEGCEMAKPESTFRKRTWNDNDGDADAARIMEGNSEFYEKFERSRKARNKAPLTILINVGGSYNLDEQELFWKCAVMIAAMDIYEAAGYQCEAWAWFRTRDSYYGTDGNKTRNFFTAYRLKDFGDPVDVGTLSKACAGWFFRTAGFAAISSAEDLEVCGGLGSFVPVVDDRINEMGIESIDNCLTVSSGIRYEETAIKAL